MTAPAFDMALAHHTTGVRGHARRTRPPDAQRGAALLTAMIIVTLVSTLASAMVWQQWRAVQVESAERDRTQATWTLSSALQFASLVLRENKGGYTALTDFWATPLAEGRVSTLNGTDKSTDPDDNSQGFLSGSIDDAHARYNLLNQITVQTPPQGGTSNIKYTTNADQLAILAAICLLANRDASMANRISTGFVEAANAGAGAPLMPEIVDQLAWFGVDQASIDALRPYVTVLYDPTKPISAGLNPTKVNANTASPEVLSAVAGIVDATLGRKIFQSRQKAPFKISAELQGALALSPADWTTLSTSLDVQSRYFEVRGKLRLADRVLSQRSLVLRDPTSFQVTALRSDRISSLEQVAP